MSSGASVAKASKHFIQKQNLAVSLPNLVTVTFRNSWGTEILGSSQQFLEASPTAPGRSIPVSWQGTFRVGAASSASSGPNQCSYTPSTVIILHTMLNTISSPSNWWVARNAFSKNKVKQMKTKPTKSVKFLNASEVTLHFKHFPDQCCIQVETPREPTSVRNIS